MNTEKSKKAHITDSDRDNILQLHKCGISTKQIESMLHISRSSINYILHAHRACVQKDYYDLRNLMKHFKPTCAWAMKVTNTDPSVLENLPEEIKPEEAPLIAPNPDTVTREEFIQLYDAVCVIRDTLIDLCNSLK